MINSICFVLLGGSCWQHFNPEKFPRSSLVVVEHHEPGIFHLLTPSDIHTLLQPGLICTRKNDLEQVLGIRAQVLKDISDAEISQDWDAVIKKYGTHYVSEVRVGGLMQVIVSNDGSCSSVCENQKSSKPTASVSASIEYLTGNTGARQFEDNFIAPKAPIYSVGGDPDLGVGCTSFESCTPYNVRSWQNKVFAQSAPYAVVLTPISLLFSNGIGRMNRCLSIDTALGNPPFSCPLLLDS